MQRIVPIALFIAVMLATGSAFGQEQRLAVQIIDSDEAEFAVIFPKLKEQAEREVPALIAEIEKQLPHHATEDAKEKLAKRQANAGVALLKLNQSEKVWPLLKHSPDPRTRSYLIHRLATLGADPHVIINRLDVETDVSIRRALLLSLGEFDTSVFSLESRKAYLPKFQKIYRSDSDPGLHAAAEWLLRNWQQMAWVKQVDEELADDKAQLEKRLNGIAESLAREEFMPQWYVNGQGQTMVVIPGPVQFMMGSPETEVGRLDKERQHIRRIGRTFSISSKLVTVQQYRKFNNDYSPANEVFAQTADLPAVEMSWFQAAAYCNWLSKEEGIPEDQWCYEINGQEKILMKNKYLRLTGYRLATEAELEYATRAGSMTARYYGETNELVAKYAWYEKNSRGKPQQVGRLKPNDLGLFDTLGNVWTWSQNQYEMYPGGEQIIKDYEGKLPIAMADSRVMRGGSFFNPSSFVRSAFRNLSAPTTHSRIIGFRLARTLPPSPLNTLPVSPEVGEIEKVDK